MHSSYGPIVPSPVQQAPQLRFLQACAVHANDGAGLIEISPFSSDSKRSKPNSIQLSALFLTLHRDTASVAPRVLRASPAPLKEMESATCTRQRSLSWMVKLCPAASHGRQYVLVALLLRRPCWLDIAQQSTHASVSQLRNSSSEALPVHGYGRLDEQGWQDLTLGRNMMRIEGLSVEAAPVIGPTWLSEPAHAYLSTASSRSDSKVKG